MKYRFQLIKSRGAILLLIVDGLMQSFQSFMLFAIAGYLDLLGMLNTPNITKDLLEFIRYIAMIFYPFGGLVADMWIGRYRMILLSMLLSFVCLLLLVVFNIVLWFHGDGILTKVVFAFFCISYIGPAGFQSTVVAFNIDQLTSYSGDEISATVYWHSLWIFTAPVSVLFLEYAFHAYPKIMQPNLYLTICLSVGGAALLLAILLSVFFHRAMDTTPQYYNPIKQIFQVLNYARKNKYPRNRSALTYWEDNYPSRLDLGMDKYGGPFTVEQVEDVKSVLKLTLTFIAILTVPLAWDGDDLSNYFSFFSSDNLFTFFIQRGGFTFSMSACQILLYQFVLYPCFTKHIPSMLNKVKIGLCFGILTTFAYIELLLWGNVTLHYAPYPLPLDYRLVMIPQAFCSVALFLVVISSFEFVVAQSPKSMRGLMVGLWYAVFGIGKIIDRALSTPFKKILHYSSDEQATRYGCVLGLYCNIFSSVAFAVVIVLMFLIAWRYKLRVRENIVPVMKIAEEHYERYFQQSDEHRMIFGGSSLSSDDELELNMSA